MPIPEKVVNVHAHLHSTMDVPARVAEWRRHNCRKVVVLADSAYWQPPNSVYLGNDGVERWMKEFPDLLVGMGNVELGQRMGSPDDVSRLKERGFTGLKLEMPSHPYDHDRYMPLYERAEQLGMPILFHTGWVYRIADQDRRSRLSAAHMHPYTLDRIARSFPDLKLIGAHLGMPHCAEAIALLLGHPNLWFDISWDVADKPFFARLKKALAPFPGADMDDPDENFALHCFERIPFGTDDPLVGDWLPVAYELLDWLRVPEATREAFFWRTADEIFGWGLEG
jgi:predicted TIM-barrel fold metal-dependent hydrolase